MPRWITILLISTTVALLAATSAQAHSHRRLWAWYRQSGARCVHRYEGSWRDPYPLYWGGFQMSLWFQERFAPYALHHYGTADHWSPYRQTIVVRRVVAGIDEHGRRRFPNGKLRPAYGWGQWSTAPLCGL